MLTWLAVIGLFAGTIMLLRGMYLHGAAVVFAAVLFLIPMGVIINVLGFLTGLLYLVIYVIYLSASEKPDESPAAAPPAPECESQGQKLRRYTAALHNKATHGVGFLVAFLTCYCLSSGLPMLLWAVLSSLIFLSSIPPAPPEPDPIELPSPATGPRPEGDSDDGDGDGDADGF